LSPFGISPTTSMNLTPPELHAAAPSAMSPRTAVFEAAATLLGLLESPWPGFARRDAKNHDANPGPPLPLKRTREALWPSSPMVNLRGNIGVQVWVCRFIRRRCGWVAHASSEAFFSRNCRHTHWRVLICP
jgi:hypothetical protein